jgi:methionine sulfoxide reductase catalytic subunit
LEPIASSEITPEHLYLTRREVLTAMGAALAGGVLLGGCGSVGDGAPAGGAAGTRLPPAGEGQGSALAGEEMTSYEAVTQYNNFYEFSLGKEEVATAARELRIEPWTVEVAGLVAKPQTFGIADLRKLGAEERVYRMRCVEAWSMVIPWLGFPLKRLLDLVEPESDARYVRFETLLDPEQMPGQRNPAFSWPYAEGLRLDEALHDLTILASGLYGKDLLPQNGAPLRLVVPWKYGFKSAKSIVRIELVADMPTTFWMASGPNEYGFWANVNPEVSHPRWSQATERRIGETGRRETLLFNGYADEVSGLYPDLELRDWYF